jgi:hypothetical protein
MIERDHGGNPISLPSKKLNRLEFFLILAILIMLSFIAYIFLSFHAREVARGNDALTENTAESVAKVNSNNGADCPVDSCPGGNCIHKVGNQYVGYYDSVGNKILSYPTKGYNSGDTMTIGEKTYKGRPGSMVLRVKTGDHKIQMDWISREDLE